MGSPGQPHVRFRRLLDTPVELAPLPAGVALVPFGPTSAPTAHAALAAAFAEVRLPVPPLAAWWEALSTDAEYDADLVLVAAVPDGTAVAIAQCWTSSFVKEVAVRPDWQRRGLGAALLTRAFARFAERGSPHVDLKVAVHNLAAQRFYRRMGMRPVDDDDQPPG